MLLQNEYSPQPRSHDGYKWLYVLSGRSAWSSVSRTSFSASSAGQVNECSSGLTGPNLPSIDR